MWTKYILWPWQRVRLIDGTRSEFGGTVMRRRGQDGRWQYRALTQAEEQTEWDERNVSGW